VFVLIPRSQALIALHFTEGVAANLSCRIGPGWYVFVRTLAEGHGVVKEAEDAREREGEAECDL
jgi:hypothetical protein